MLLIGTALKVERIQGSKPATPTSDARSWDFTQVTIWDGHEVHVALVGRDYGPAPIDGEEVVAEVAVSPRRNSRSGAWENSVNLIAPADLGKLLDRLGVADSSAARAA